MNQTAPKLPTMPVALIRPERCEKCKFASAIPGQMAKFQCRYNPPTVVSVPQAGPHGGVHFIVDAAFPPVPPGYWCGQFKAHVEGMN